MPDLPIVCTLEPGDLGRRAESLRTNLVKRCEELVEQADGVRLRFAPSEAILETIAQVIEAERRCCRFLRFQLTVDPDEGPIWLEMTGPPGTAEFLADITGS
jgi:hypothetical protein